MKKQKSNFLKKTTILLMCFLAAMTFSSCSEDDADVIDFIPGEGFEDTKLFLPEKGSTQINFTANTNWTAQSNKEWLKLDQMAQTSGKAGSASVYVSYEENLDVNDRQAAISITVGATIKTITVTQKAAGRVIAFDGTDTLNITKENPVYDVDILSNVEWELAENDALPEWISVSVKETTVEGKQVNKLHVEILNQDGADRWANVVLRDKNQKTFTQILVIKSVGWGEKYVDWSMTKVLFDENGGDDVITATFAGAMKPRAFLVNGTDTTSTVADWVTFQLTPAGKAAIQEEVRWTMTVDPYSVVGSESRAAIIYVVPESMTDQEVFAQKSTWKSVVINQTSEIPTGKFLVQVFIKDPNGGPVGSWGFLPGTEEALTWSMMNNPTGNRINVSFESNCAYGNLREVKVVDGVDVICNKASGILPYTGLTDSQLPAISQLGLGSMNAEVHWLVMDLYAGNTQQVIGDARYKLDFQGMGTPPPVQ